MLYKGDKMISVVLSAVASVLSGLILYFLQRYFKKKEKIEEEREKQHHKKDALIIKSIEAVGKLTEANSIALRDGKTNGEMHEALNNYKNVEQEMLDFLIEKSIDKGE